MKKLVICTGANGGIGKHYCREMLSRNYHVIMACRNEESGQRVLEELKAEFPKQSLELMIIDMGSLASIERFADKVLQKYGRLDGLVHNAGVYFFDKERRISANNIELNFALHFIGPFALTSYLFPLLKKTKDSRVVIVSSSEHRGSPVDLNDIQIESDFSSIGNMEAYSRSKWAGMAFFYELHHQIKDKQLGMHAVAAHPGISLTGIQLKGEPNAFQKLLFRMLGNLLTGKPEDAAKPLVMATVEGENGEFFGPTGFKEIKGEPGKVAPDAGIEDVSSRKTLWNAAEQLTGLSFL
ncbi:MAG: SDR family NAD(P)-dependent oxidoreductase [Chloroflexota bacterium]